MAQLLTAINHGYIVGNTLTNAYKDLKALQTVGITKGRGNISPYNNSGQIAFYRSVCLAAIQEFGFTNWIHGVTFPHSSPGQWLTKSQWPALRAGVLAEANWVAQQNNTRIEFSGTNELERQRYVTISSLTQSNGTATAVTPYAHQFTNGSSIVIRNATPSAYNGTKTITVTNSTTFTFAIDSGTASPATGSIQGTDFTDDEIMQYIKDLYVEVKAILPNNPCSHAVPAGSPNQSGVSHQWPAMWLAAGIGSMDRIGFNLYEPVPRFFESMYATIKTYPAGKAFLSEWGLDSNGYMASTYNNEELLRQKLRARAKRFQADNIEAYFFEYQDPNDLFGGKLLLTSGWRKFWADLLGRRAWYWPGTASLNRTARPRVPIASRTPISRQPYEQ